MHTQLYIYICVYIYVDAYIKNFASTRWNSCNIHTCKHVCLESFCVCIFADTWSCCRALKMCFKISFHGKNRVHGSNPRENSVETHILWIPFALESLTCGSARHLHREARMLALILSLEVFVQVLMFQDLYVVFLCCLPESGQLLWFTQIFVRMTPCIEPDHANSLLQLLLVMIFIV